MKIFRIIWVILAINLCIFALVLIPLIFISTAPPWLGYWGLISVLIIPAILTLIQIICNFRTICKGIKEFIDKGF